MEYVHDSMDACWLKIHALFAFYITVSSILPMSLSSLGALSFYTIHRFIIHIKNPCHGDVECIHYHCAGYLGDKVRAPDFIREALYAPLSMNMFADESHATALSRPSIQTWIRTFLLDHIP